MRKKKVKNQDGEVFAVEEETTPKKGKKKDKKKGKSKDKKNKKASSKSKSKDKDSPKKKGKKSKDASGSAKGEAKKGKKKKSKKSIIGSFDFSESVLEVMRDKLSLCSGAVRYVDRGYVLISVTDDMLSDFTAKDEAIGSFAKAVTDGSISTVVLASDIESGRLVIAPDEESLSRMEEYSFLRKMEFEPVFFSDDMDDEDSVKVFNGVIDFKTLQKIADHNLTFEIEGNDIAVVDGVDFDTTSNDDINSMDNMAFDDIIDEESLEAGDTSGLENENDLDELSDFTDITDIDMGQEEIEPDANFQFSLEDDVAAGDFPEEDFDFGEEGDFGYDEMMDIVDDAEVQTKDDVDKIIERCFLNDDLEISVTDELFNVHFDSSFENIPLFQFSSRMSDEDSELEDVIRKMAETANTNIQRIHHQNLSALKEDYFHTLSQERENIARQLDLDSDDNEYGLMMIATKELTEELTREKGRYIREKREELEADYDKDRQNVVNAAIAASSSRFDALHQPELKRKIQTIEDNFDIEVKQSENDKRVEILAARKEKAAALYNSATVRVLQALSDEYRRMQEEELEIYEEEKHKMDVYLRENFANDVMRARAIRDELARHNEVDDLKARYAELQEINERKLEQNQKQANDSLKAISQKHDRIVEEITKEFEAQLAKSKKREEAAYDDFKKLQADYAAIDEKKNAEFSHRLTLLQDEIDAKNMQINSLQEEMSKKNNISIVLLAVVAVAFLAVGIALGFIVTPAHAETINNVSEPSTSMSIFEQIRQVGFLNFFGTWLSGIFGA